MRAKAIVLLVLMGVVIVCASASVWLPRVKRVWRVESSRSEPPCTYGSLIGNVCYPPFITPTDVQFIDSECTNLQACKVAVSAELSMRRATAGAPAPAPIIKRLGPIPKGWTPPRFTPEQTWRPVPLPNEDLGQENLRERISDLQERMDQGEFEKKIEDEERWYCESINALNGALDIDAGCR
jgi:hypothetical protein